MGHRERRKNTGDSSREMTYCLPGKLTTLSTATRKSLRMGSPLRRLFAPSKSGCSSLFLLNLYGRLLLWKLDEEPLITALA